MPEINNQHLERHEDGLNEQYKNSEITKEQLKSFIEYGVKNSRSILIDPAKLNSFVSQLDKVPLMVNNEMVIRKMIESVKSDTSLLKTIIDLYKKETAHERQGWVCHNAVRSINLVDDVFFKRIFKEAVDSGLRAQIIAKIHDQEYLKKVIEKYSKDSIEQRGGGYYIATLACKNIKDQRFLEKMSLDENIHNMIREVAVSKLNNKQILSKFANLSDREADQSYTVNGKRLYDTPEKWERPYTLGVLRKAARERLKTIGHN